MTYQFDTQGPLLYQKAVVRPTRRIGPLVDPQATWSLTPLREKLIKIGAKIVRDGQYIPFQLAEVAVPTGLFRKILSLINDLRPRPAPA